MGTIIIRHRPLPTLRASETSATADTKIPAGATQADVLERSKALDHLRSAEANGVPTDHTSIAAQQVLQAAAAVCTRSCSTCPFSTGGGSRESTCHSVKQLAERAGRLAHDGSLRVAKSCAGSCDGCSCTPDEPFVSRTSAE